MPSAEWPPKSTDEVPGLDVRANIKVVGVGGGGSNAVNRMIQAEVRGVEFICVNTDAQALLSAQSSKRIRLGKGLGAGGNPVIGNRAAEESSDDLYEVLKDADMIFITAGMGGGTGTGAAPVIAQIAKEVGALTVGVVTKPFTFEGNRRRQVAEEGIAQLKDKVDTLICIPNDRLLQVVDKETTIEAAFGVVDDVLRQGIQGISELITMPGLINLDFADVKAIMSSAGSALMAIGRGSGENRAVDAARAAIASPLLDVTVDGARGVLFNVCGANLTLFEVNEAAQVIHQAADPEANIIFGASIDPTLEGEVRITLLAAGFNAKPNVMPTSIPRNTAVVNGTPLAGVQSLPERIVARQQLSASQVDSEEMEKIPAFLRKYARNNGGTN